MIVYEVNIGLRADIYADYRAWLAPHVAEILAVPGFVSAEIFEVLDPAPAEGRRALSVCYRLADQAALDRYLVEHAPRLREDGVRRFGGAFAATRRVLRTV
jgi:antibiotic biosynthesis monooxygenase (ABM) superfamily enzyme